jgi:hypothetical protein
MIAVRLVILILGFPTFFYLFLRKPGSIMIVLVMHVIINDTNLTGKIKLKGG